MGSVPVTLTSSPETPPNGQKLRVLFLASYFPRPGNLLLGTWAMDQALALVRQGVDLRTASFTSWVPRLLALSRGAKAYAQCPSEHSWDGLRVQYPRWLFYPIGGIGRRTQSNPEFYCGLTWLSAKGKLRKLVKEHQPDLIYAHHSLPNGLMAYHLHQEFNLPYVITNHSFEDITDCEKWPGRRRLFGKVANDAAMMVSVSRRMEADTRRIFPQAPVCTIHNGANPMPDDVLKRPRPSELAGRNIIFSAGMFAPRKAFPLLVDAFARIAPKHPEAILRIAGDGQERHKVEQAIRDLGVGSQVQLLGFQPHASVLQEMAWCDAFALIGWDEPFATVFSEALSAGKPIVCANDGGINDVVRNGIHGYMVAPHDVDAAAGALDRLLSDQPTRQKMSEAALELSNSELTWDANARRISELFHQCVGG